MSLPNSLQNYEDGDNKMDTPWQKRSKTLQNVMLNEILPMFQVIFLMLEARNSAQTYIVHCACALLDGGSADEVCTSTKSKQGLATCYYGFTTYFATGNATALKKAIVNDDIPDPQCANIEVVGLMNALVIIVPIASVILLIISTIMVVKRQHDGIWSLLSSFLVNGVEILVLVAIVMIPSYNPNRQGSVQDNTLAQETFYLRLNLVVYDVCTLIAMILGGAEANAVRQLNGVGQGGKRVLNGCFAFMYVAVIGFNAASLIIAGGS
jgi:hypothetical protein